MEYKSRDNETVFMIVQANTRDFSREIQSAFYCDNCI